MRSAVAFTVVKVIGGCYLVALGIWMIWRVRRRRRPAPEPSTTSIPAGTKSLYVQALLANALNPKAAAVYLTLPPQFLTAAQVSMWPMLVMASIHVVVMPLWLAVWAGALSRGRRLVRSPRFGLHQPHRRHRAGRSRDSDASNVGGAAQPALTAAVACTASRGLKLARVSQFRPRHWSGPEGEQPVSELLLLLGRTCERVDAVQEHVRSVPAVEELLDGAEDAYLKHDSDNDDRSVLLWRSHGCSKPRGECFRIWLY